MVLPLVVYSNIENGYHLERPITLFYDGTPFYFSASKPKGTALPFFAIAEKGSIVHLEMSETDPLSSLITTLKIYSKKVNWELFGSIKNVMISSILGGGIWDTPPGESIKKILMAKDRDFYMQYGQNVTFEGEGEGEELCELYEASGVNGWITTHKMSILRKSLSTLFALGMKIEEIPNQKIKGFHPSNSVNVEKITTKIRRSPTSIITTLINSEDSIETAPLPESPKTPIVRPLQ